METNEPNPRVVIAGGSGFLGVSLAHHLARGGWKVTILSRQRPPCEGPWRHVAWDARTLGPWTGCLEAARGLVNMVGRTVDCLKTPDHCDEILRSRVEATRILGMACRAITGPPSVWVQMSTAHIYGDPPQAWCDEQSVTGHGLAPTVGRAWEEAFSAAVMPAQRGVILRTSFVIGRNRGAGRGALGRLAPVARLGLGGTVGSGTQGMSWIHEEDMNRLLERSLADPSMRGIYVASAPNPVSNAEFMRHLRRAVPWPKIPLGLPTLEWMVRLGAPLLMRTDPDLALYGRYVISTRLAAEGFVFRHPALPEALKACFAPQEVRPNR